MWEIVYFLFHLLFLLEFTGRPYSCQEFGKFFPKEFTSWDFLVGPLVQNPPSSAGDVGSTPGQGTKIPHAVGQLNLQAATTETTHSRACVPQQRSHVPQPGPDTAK